MDPRAGGVVSFPWRVALPTSTGPLFQDFHSRTPHAHLMLILSRKTGDAIVIGDGIRIVVLESDRRGVRLGIEAPPEVSILREEIVTAIASENLRATATSDAAGWLEVLPVKNRKS